MRVLTLLLVLMAGVLLGACAAPSTHPATANPGEIAGPARPAPPMSSPLPAQELRAPVRLDTGCKTSADCAVKNVGNCCGAMPACVNRDSAVDPAAVKAQCQANNTMSVCGFREISACQCDNGRCVEADPAPGRRGVPLQERKP